MICDRSCAYVFDIDGTLTPARQSMQQPMIDFLDKWLPEYAPNVYFVTGSDLDKVKEQVPSRFLNRINLFTCLGNVAYLVDGTVEEREVEWPSDLKADLEGYLNFSSYPEQWGTHIEERVGMINFSVVGRECTQEARMRYYEWDKEHGERDHIAKELRENYPELDISIGGQISIDIVPRGHDKSQIIPYIKERPILFFGDKIIEGGNDWSLAKALVNQSINNRLYQIDGGPDQVISILREKSTYRETA